MLRRTFLKASSIATATVAVSPRLFAAVSPPKIAVGLDNYSIRSLGWKAPQLIDYAASIKCDTLFISDLESYESLDDAALRLVRSRAEKAGLALYAGGSSAGPTSPTLRKNYGTPEEYPPLRISRPKAL